MSTIVGLVGLKMEATDASDEEQNRSMCNDFSCFCSSSESVSARRRNGRRKMVSASAWGGSMAGKVLQHRKEATICRPGPVTPWQPRGDHFYDNLRREQPRKFSCKGVHAKHGGPVACHQFEETGPVSIDHDRVNERHLLEFSGGRDSDIYGEHKDFDSVLAKSRPKYQEMRRQKGFLFSEQNGTDGKWLKEMDHAKMFYYTRMRIGHQALGYAGGCCGYWGKPPPRRGQEKF